MYLTTVTIFVKMHANVDSTIFNRHFVMEQHLSMAEYIGLDQLFIILPWNNNN